MKTRMTRILSAVPRFVWRFTGKPIHRRLFGVYFEAIIGRLNSALGELSNLRSELSKAQDQIVEGSARQEELERQMRTVIASHWDTTALTRRLIAIEERLAEPEPSARAEHAASGEAHADARERTGTREPVQS